MSNDKPEPGIGKSKRGMALIEGEKVACANCARLYQPNESECPCCGSVELL